MSTESRSSFAEIFLSKKRDEFIDNDLAYGKFCDRCGALELISGIYHTQLCSILKSHGILIGDEPGSQIEVKKDNKGSTSVYSLTAKVSYVLSSTIGDRVKAFDQLTFMVKSKVTWDMMRGRAASKDEGLVFRVLLNKAFNRRRETAFVDANIPKRMTKNQLDPVVGAIQASRMENLKA